MTICESFPGLCSQRELIKSQTSWQGEGSENASLRSWSRAWLSWGPGPSPACILACHVPQPADAWGFLWCLLVFPDSWSGSANSQGLREASGLWAGPLPTLGPQGTLLFFQQGFTEHLNVTAPLLVLGVQQQTRVTPQWTQQPRRASNIRSISRGTDK